MRRRCAPAKIISVASSSSPELISQATRPLTATVLSADTYCSCFSTSTRIWNSGIPAGGASTLMIKQLETSVYKIDVVRFASICRVQRPDQVAANVGMERCLGVPDRLASDRLWARARRRPASSASDRTRACASPTPAHLRAQRQPGLRGLSLMPDGTRSHVTPSQPAQSWVSNTGQGLHPNHCKLAAPRP
jgi:hypothetical protein